MNYTLTQRFLPDTACVVIDTYDYDHALSGEQMTAMLLVPTDGPDAGRYAYQIAIRDGVRAGALHRQPIDMLGSLARIVGEWCDERGSGLDRTAITNRILDAQYPKFSAADVVEVAQVYGEAS